MDGDEIRYCEALARRFDRERWLCTLFAPEAARPALLALLAFASELGRIREQAREPHMALVRLQWWRDALAEARSGAPRAHPVCRALAATLAGDPALEPILSAMVDAREKDIEDWPFADLDELSAYAGSSSGGLAEAMLRASMREPDDAALAAARRLGRAWALVGLLRATPHLATLRRCALPSASFARTGIDHEAWFAGRAGREAAPLAREVARAAEAGFASVARGGIPRAGFAVSGLRLLGRMHLATLAAAGHDLFDPRVPAQAPLAPARLALARLLGTW
ncbi:MAG: phytoene/squalene synthase family protein [Alphaproteobacteria bacterium]